MYPLTPANESELEFAEEGQALAAEKMQLTAPGTPEHHSACHEFIDWTTIKSFGTHSAPCIVTCTTRTERSIQQ